MSAIKFSVFGRLVLVEHTTDGWRAFYPGADGLRRPVDFIIPDFIEEAELEQYLGDLFHEAATPRHSEVQRLEQ
ncbi:MAG: hypothetical protein JWP34_3172 [Massilia sp.]|nr:hypothetical protein [Massilia sp.]